jgi:hypothetical protein
MRHTAAAFLALFVLTYSAVADPDSDVFQPGSCRKHFSDLALDCKRQDIDPCTLGHFHLLNCTAACRIFQIYTEIRVRQGWKRRSR